MSDAVQLESNVAVTPTGADQSAPLAASYQVVSAAQRNTEDELYGFRAAMMQAHQQA